MPSLTTCQELYNRERGLNAALQGLNPKSPQFDTVAARMTDALNKLRTDVSLLDDPAEQSLLKERTKIIESRLVEARIPKEIDALASDLKTIEATPENQATRALGLHQKIQQLINHKTPMLSPDQRQRLAEMQKRAMDLVPEAPEDRRIRLTRSFALASGVRPFLRGMRDALRELVLLEKDAKSLFIKFRKSHEKQGTALTKSMWTVVQPQKKPIDHFGSKVLRGDDFYKMPTKDILYVIDYHLAHFPAGKDVERQKLQNLRQAISDQRDFLRDACRQLTAIDPAIFDMLEGYRKEDGYQLITGDLFCDPRILIAILNRMIDSLDHAEGYQPFPLLPDHLVSHLGQFLKLQDVYAMRKADTRCASGLLTDFYLLPHRENIDRKLGAMTSLPLTRELREVFAVDFFRENCALTEKNLAEMEEHPMIPRGFEVRSNAELDRFVSLFAPMNGGTLYIASPTLTRVSSRLGELRGLRRLLIQCTSLQELPPSVGLLSKLQYLYIWFPTLEARGPLPKSYRNLTELETASIRFGIEDIEQFRAALPPAEAAASPKISVIEEPDRIEQTKDSSNGGS